MKVLVFGNSGSGKSIYARALARREGLAHLELQNKLLGQLQEWVADYYQREDAWSYRVHREIFDAFAGRKVEHRDIDAYTA